MGHGNRWGFLGPRTAAFRLRLSEAGERSWAYRILRRKAAIIPKGAQSNNAAAPARSTNSLGCRLLLNLKKRKNVAKCYIVLHFRVFGSKQGYRRHRRGLGVAENAQNATFVASMLHGLSDSAQEGDEGERVAQAGGAG